MHKGLFDPGTLDKLDGKRSLSFHEIKKIGTDLRILARFI